MFHVADAHTDFLYKMVNSGADIAKPVAGQQLFLSERSPVALQVFAAWMDRRKAQQYHLQAFEMFDAFERMLEANPRLKRFERGSEFPPKDGSTYAMLAVEGGETLTDAFMVRTLYRMGVRSIALTWNHKNRLGYPAMGRSSKGLTDLGKELVAEMARLGMAVDVSHLNDAGIDDVLKLSRKGRAPLASHSNARGVRNHPRNLSDRHIRAIAGMGGFIGVNFYRPFLGPGAPGIETVADHIEYIGRTGSWKCVGLGSDFDGMELPAEGLETCERFGALLNALRARGHSEDVVSDIAGGNYVRYIRQFL